MNETAKHLSEGRLLPLMEEFYSLQGEGFHTGSPAWFIRLAGCDVACSWCDVKASWDADLYPLVAADDIVSHALQCPAKAVVVTGGEPLQCNLDYLCSLLKKNSIQTFLETSGSEILSGQWNWVCLSPKKNAPPLDIFYLVANELKVVISDCSDFEWAEKCAKKVNKHCRLFLQPEWRRYDGMIKKIADYIMQNPLWRISLQSHKFMRIP